MISVIAGLALAHETLCRSPNHAAALAEHVALEYMAPACV